MPTRPGRRVTTAHQEAITRRLTELSAQLANARAEAPALAETSSGIEAGDAVELAPTAGDGPWWGEYTRVPPRVSLALVPALDSATTIDPTTSEGSPAPDSPAVPVVVAVPGRHASRRRVGLREWCADLLPDTLRGQVRIAPAQAAVLAVVVALGLGLTCWWLVRGDPAPAVPASAAPALLPETAPSAALSPPSDAGASAGTTAATAVAGTPAPQGNQVTVDVAGRVRHPGIVVLPAGSRVVDAVRRAGGARPGVDLTALNLARPLTDGEQILVGTTAAAPGVAPPVGATSGVGAAPPTTPTTPVNLNTATEPELESLPDVGPVTAGAILAWRQQNGAFSSVSELLEVDGIGDATLAKLAPLVTV